MPKNGKPAARGDGNSAGKKSSRSSDSLRNSKSSKEGKAQTGTANRQLEPDREDLTKFVSVLFKHATPGNWVSLRSFPDKGSGSDDPFKITPVKLNGDLNALIDRAFRDAKIVANVKDKIVFCPPTATFDKRYVAREEDLAEGLVLSAECDRNAQEGRAKLEALLGPATIIVESGGEWIDPETGEVKPRLHVYFLLKKPAREKDELKNLKLARQLATAIVGGDGSNVTIVHPIRWPGSWHRKGEPKLARIADINADAEIDLDAALTILRKAAPEIDCKEHAPNKDLQADPDLIYAAMAVVPNLGVQDGDQDEWDEWNTKGMAIFGATGGHERGLEAFDMWSRKSPKYNEAKTRARWKHYFRHPPTEIGAGSVIHWANEAHPDWREEYDQQTWDQITERLAEAKDQRSNKQQNSKQQQQKSKQSKQDEAAPEKVEPVDLWAQREPPPLPKGLLPKLIEEFAFRQAKLMGCDPAGLAMGALVVCCAVIPDSIKLQVKKHDLRWRESTRIWVAFEGPPSVQKSPIKDRVIEPLNRIDAELSRQYQDAKAAYEEMQGDEKKNAEKPKHERVRFEDVTPEAAQPILRDSPDGLLLVRDELSGWFGSIDKYSGTRGGGMDRGFWLQAFNGGVYSWDRVSRGSGNIPNLSICVLGGIQEEPLRKLVNDGVDDGLIQRLFIIMLRPAVMGTDKPQPPDQYDKLIERLYALRRNLGHEERNFTDEAQAIRRQLEQQHLDLAAGYEKINKKLAAHIGKYKGLFARLCLLWHTIETLDDVWPSNIDEDVAQRVAKFMNDFLLQHAVAFYIGLLGLSDQHDRLLDVGGYILAHKLDNLTTRDIQRGSRSMRNLEKRDTDRIFEQLEAYGWLERKTGKRFSDVTWVVNSEVHRLFAAKAKEERERRQREQAEVVASMPKKG